MTWESGIQPTVLVSILYIRYGLHFLSPVGVVSLTSTLSWRSLASHPRFRNRRILLLGSGDGSPLLSATFPRPRPPRRFPTRRRHWPLSRNRLAAACGLVARFGSETLAQPRRCTSHAHVRTATLSSRLRTASTDTNPLNYFRPSPLTMDSFPHYQFDFSRQYLPLTFSLYVLVHERIHQ